MMFQQGEAEISADDEYSEPPSHQNFIDHSRGRFESFQDKSSTLTGLQNGALTAQPSEYGYDLPLRKSNFDQIYNFNIFRDQKADSEQLNRFCSRFN